MGTILAMVAWLHGDYTYYDGMGIILATMAWGLYTYYDGMGITLTDILYCL